MSTEPKLTEMIRIHFDSGRDDNGNLYTAAVVTLSGENKGHIFFTKQNLGFEDLRCSSHFEMLGLCTIISQIMDTMPIVGKVCVIGDNARTLSLLNGQGSIKDEEVHDDLRMANHINMMLVNSGATHIMFSRKSSNCNLFMYICDYVCDWYKKATKRNEDNFTDTIHARIRNALKQGKKFDVDVDIFDAFLVSGV